MTIVQRRKCWNSRAVRRARRSGIPPNKTAAGVRAQSAAGLTFVRQMYSVFVAKSEASIHLLDGSWRYGIEAYVKSTPAAVRDARPMSAPRSPRMPGEVRNMNPAKCSAINNQPVSHSLEIGVWPRCATEAKAQVRSATAARSGSLVQSNTFTPWQPLAVPQLQ